MMATGLWQDTVYSACCFMGARCKAQCLRHNIDEIAGWPDLQCHRTHAADEWQPYLQDGQRVFPSKEEAEYTASLAFGIAAWWAARVGLAKLHVPRFPLKPQAGGNIGCVSTPEPSAIKQWHLQLSLCSFAQPIPKRERGPHSGHEWWMSFWRTRPCHLGSSMWDEATTAIASQSPNRALRFSRPQLRPVFLAPTLCGTHYAALGR